MRGGPTGALPAGTGADTTELTHMWQKPCFADLFACLQGLRMEPPVWSLKTPRTEILEKQQHHVIDSREIISFLSLVIKSSLTWIDDDYEREQIWDEASKRLTERCGRTAMGEITRQWPFENPEYGAFALTIREPTLTGDSLGLKTWGSSYVLARLLHEFSAGTLAHLLPPRAPPRDILELGSGTGLLGLAAAAIWRANVVLTDLPGILSNLAHNAELNMATIEARGGRAEAAALTWGINTDESDPRFSDGRRFELVLAADSLYDDDHPALLSSTIDVQLGLGTDARVLAMVPQRDDITEELLSTFKKEMAGLNASLRCIDEGTVPGEDDWGDQGDDDETRRLGFWWGVFKRDTLGR